MRLILTIIITLFYIVINAQNTTTLITAGYGKTPLEAQHSALRSVLE